MTPQLLAVLGIAVIGIAAGGFFLLRARPVAAVDIQNLRIEVYSFPGWSVRAVPKSYAFVVFATETGWMGHGTAKYIKAKGDFKLHEQVTDLAPIPPGHAVSVPLTRLPARRLVVTNIYDESSLTGATQFAAGFDAAVEETLSNGGDSITFKDPTDDWNYFTHRVDAEDTAHLILEQVLRNRGKLRAVRILVTDPANVGPYARLVERLNEERWKYVGNQA